MQRDIAIVGGGLAGPAAAIALAKAGRDVALVEREVAAQHKVCGEFLSREALQYLQALGVQAEQLGAVPIRKVRLAGRRGVSECALPFAAMSLTRRCLDEALLRLAEQAGALVLRGSSVRSVARIEHGWRVSLADASSLNASAVFMATGKHDLHGRPRPAGLQPDLIGFKMYWRLAPEQVAELDGCVELNLFRGGYGGLQPVEGGLANLCCLVRRAEFQRMGGCWEGLLQAMQQECPHLALRLQGAAPMLAKPLAIASIPYGFVRQHAEGLWCLGDQAAVIPSFTGDGMSLALHSGVLAAQMYLEGKRAEDFQQKMYSQVARQVSFATMLSRGLLRQPQRSAMMCAITVWPRLLRSVANRTRIPAAAVAEVLPAPQKAVALDAASMGSY